MITFAVDRSVLQTLLGELNGSNEKIRKQIAIATNITATKTIGPIAKQVATELAATQKNIKKTIKIKKKARDSEKQPTGVVSLLESERLPLKDYKAKQNKQGVTYKISTSKGKRVIPGAFIVDSLGGHVFKRRGKSRLPIDKLFGPSPWGVFVIKKMKKPVVKASKKQLIYEIGRRIRFMKLK